MKAPVLIVTVTLALAILLAGWLLIATTRGENAPASLVRSPHEPTGRANARPMTGSATCGVGLSRISLCSSGLLIQLRFESNNRKRVTKRCIAP